MASSVCTIHPCVLIVMFDDVGRSLHVCIYNLFHMFYFLSIDQSVEISLSKIFSEFQVSYTMFS